MSVIVNCDRCKKTLPKACRVHVGLFVRLSEAAMVSSGGTVVTYPQVLTSSYSPVHKESVRDVDLCDDCKGVVMAAIESALRDSRAK